MRVVVRFRLHLWLLEVAPLVFGLTNRHADYGLMGGSLLARQIGVVSGVVAKYVISDGTRVAGYLARCVGGRLVTRFWL